MYTLINEPANFPVVTREARVHCQGQVIALHPVATVVCWDQVRTATWHSRHING